MPAPANESGQHRDAHLEIEELARKSGPIKQTAVESVIAIHAPFFTQVGPDLRHRLTGETIEEYVRAYRTKHPEYYLDWTPDRPDQIEFEMIEDACLRPSPKSVGKLFTELGEQRAKELLKQWGTDWVRMLPGERPGYAEKKKIENGPPGGGGQNNPWSKAWVGSEDARDEKLGAIIKTGTKFAAQMAAAAGTTVGRPLRK